MSSAVSSSVPSHVPPALIFPFDLYGLNDDARLDPDVQQGLTFLHKNAPDVFFTPANGGHWVTTRYDLMCEVLKDPAHFSSAHLTVPRAAAQQKLIPLSLDPPEHTPYRQILMRYFAPKPIEAMEPSIRARARELIAKVAGAGHCDFMEAAAVPLPVFVFMEMMGLPLEKYREFREIVVEWFGIPNGPRRSELALVIIAHLREAIEARMAAPKDDLISRLINEQLDGRKITQAEVESISFLLFLAGLDTVANGAGFIFTRLARMPDVQRQLAADPKLIQGFVDEGLRTSGVVTTARVIVSDVELGGVALKAGDMIICPLALAGYDERANAEPTKFDIARRTATHLMFSTGPHLCVGHVLARAELRILAEEWMAAVPNFRLSPTYKREVRIGSITGLMNLDLVWDPI